VNVADKKLTGRIAVENIKMMQVPRPPDGVVRALSLRSGDPTGSSPTPWTELGIPSASSARRCCGRRSPAGPWSGRR